MIVCTFRSASPLDCGYSGLEVVILKPQSPANLDIWWLAKGVIADKFLGDAVSGECRLQGCDD